MSLEQTACDGKYLFAVCDNSKNVLIKAIHVYL